jgi:hypothetical protein
MLPRWSVGSLAVLLVLAPWACSSTEGAAPASAPDAASTVEAGDETPVDAGPELVPYDPDLDPACMPGFELQIDPDAGADASIFTDAVPDPEALVREVGVRVCRVLYRKPAEVRKATHLTLLIKDDPLPGWKSGDGAQITVMISTGHLADVKAKGGDVLTEIKGILHHEMTHMYQNDDKAPGEGTYASLGNVIEGVADFVRIRSGFPPDGAVPTKTGVWDSEGYWKPAFFLLWIDDQYPDFLYRMNLGMLAGDGVAWTPDAIASITGRSVADLWSDYANAACCKGRTQTCCK